MKIGSESSQVLRVHQKTWEAQGVTSVTFVHPEGEALPRWEPGAHLSLHLPNGLVREYSLCSDPDDTSRWSVAVLRVPDSRGGSRLIHDELPIGAEILVDGPRNLFQLDGESPRHLLVAGGIGITPIVAMTRALEAKGADWHLLYTGRSREVMAFVDEISGLPRDRVTVHVDDEVGGFADISSILAEVDERTVVYCCGPATLMEAVEISVPDTSRLRLERFRAPEPAAAPDTPDGAFDVVVDSTGERVHVGADTSILDALAEVGHDVPFSCTEGICGTCETGVVSGEIDHRDYLLSDDEKESGETMCICVSRCRGSELVLDL
ncbi:PDR/VanB family oxidoreductase [Janibacter cremeus]|uniref:Ferredoxin-NADP reductase n=1 Tax=Janibacter cremeus TaxID=1285192 RepID=A0A852VLW3_9MICO|nr:PDR/VanB family oxidoreductase [Janibacter cremeus]NYF98067.1 ferredoxin-NADP reductase [Janibacter cremeus]